MGKLGLGFAALVVAFTFTSVSAGAEAGAEKDEFGRQGQLVIDNRFHLLATTTRAPQVQGSLQYLELNPSAAYFVLPRFSIGLGASFSRRSAAEGFGPGLSNVNTVGLAPRFGYAVPLTERLNLYPEVEVAWSHAWSSQPLVNNGNLGVGVYVPLLFRPAPHFFLGIGPAVMQRWYRWEGSSYHEEYRELGVRSTLGGYFDL